jgi:hypothetical protein
VARRATKTTGLVQQGRWKNHGINWVMDWIYLSPHFDDAALSCGGLIWEQSRAGQAVSVWTICAAVPKDAELSPFAESLHQRWQTGEQAASLRRMEDIASNQAMGVSYRYFDLPDCIYRKDSSGNFLYDTEESLFGPLHPDEELLVPRLAWQMSDSCWKGSCQPGLPPEFGWSCRPPVDSCSGGKVARAEPHYADVVLPRFSLCFKKRSDPSRTKGKGLAGESFFNFRSRTARVG